MFDILAYNLSISSMHWYNGCMYTFNIKLANLNIHISTIYRNSVDLCRNYLIDDNLSDFNVVINQDCIDEERSNCDFDYSDGYLETIALYRQIGNILPIYSGLIMHGACIEYKNKGYMFVAPSGTGKTTHINLWLKHLRGVRVINGDKPIIRLIDNKPVIFGTPWNGKERMGDNCSCILDSIIVLNRGVIDKIKEISTYECIDDLINKIYIPEDKMIECFDLVNSMFKDIKLYRLECTMNDSAFVTSFEALTGGKYEG